jgi:hypothetical protein
MTELIPPRLSQHDAERLTKLVTRGKLISVLNNTKWNELIQEMDCAPSGMAPEYRTRSVFAPDDFVTSWDHGWKYHLRPVADLEWLEIRASSKDWLLSVLKKLNIPYSEEKGILRIWGYTKPGPQPVWK